MNIEELRKFCLNLKGTTEDYPFGRDTLVFKVAGKIYAIASMKSIPLQINLKCNPEKAIELREKYEAVKPGFHMNKKHWNTVIVDGSIRDDEIKKWVKESYELVISGLTDNLKAKFFNN